MKVDHRRLDDVAGSVSRETFERLLGFQELFARWAETINLVAPSTLDQLWTRHVLDSAQLLKLMPAARSWLDLGSGGGFPGAVIAILMAERGGTVELIESNGKKAAFLRTALAAAGAPARVFHCRVEDAPGRVRLPQVVTARALAPLLPLLDLAAPWLQGGAVGLFHKGRDAAREIEEALRSWSFDLVQHRSAVDSDGVVLELRHLSPRQTMPKPRAHR